MPRGKRGRPPNLTLEESLAASTLTFREAAQKYGLGYTTWKALRENKGFLPFKGGGLEEEVVSSILEDVRQRPHLATTERARQLGVGTGTLQAFLHDRGLSKLNARLGFAGYQVETARPLAIARLRRIVASHPGSLTHIDYKTFGFLRGARGEPSVRLGGFVYVDSLTSYATVHLAKAPDGFEAVAGLQQYIEGVPFDLSGVVLTDNGGAFLSDFFINAVRKACLLHRTIRPAHPWSNGKVEALNKTLKYQCFAAIAGNVGTWREAVLLVEAWMKYYNETRSHGGHTNKGLPPRALYNLWKNTPGDELEKLITMGILKMDDQWHVRLMGSNGTADGEHELPYAFVMQKANIGSELQVRLGIPAPGLPAGLAQGKCNNFSPAR